MASCRYNPRFKVCQPGAQGSGVAPECAVLDNKCLLKEEYLQKTGQEYTQSITPPMQTTPVIRTSELTRKERVEPAITTITDKFTYLSGPVSIYVFQGQVGDGPNRIFTFLGDHHFSKTHTCESPPINQHCSKIGPDLRVINEKSNCYDVTYLLTKIFEDATANQTFVDFFIEIPIKSPGQSRSVSLDQLALEVRKPTYNPKILEIINDLDYMNQLELIFYPCLQPDKSLCPYQPYVRTHYADARLRDLHLTTVGTHLFVEQVKNLALNIQLLSRIVEMSYDEDTIKFRNYLRDIIVSAAEWLNEVILRMTTTGRSLAGPSRNYTREIFETFIYSDDFPTDIERLLTELTADIKVSSQKEPRVDSPIVEMLLKNFKESGYDWFQKFRAQTVVSFVVKDGKKISRTRSQLLSLRKDNIIHEGQNLADLLESFLLQEFANIDVSEGFRFWQRLYRGIIPDLARARSNSDFSVINYNMGSFGSEASAMSIYSDTLIMDGYLLARMFRLFPGKPHTVSSQVYVYAGDYHIRNYAEFFANYLHLPLLVRRKSDSDNFRCLKVPPIPENN